MTPDEKLQKLMLEAIPDGTFGGARRVSRPASRRDDAPQPSQSAWTVDQQAKHLAELAAALDGFELDDDYAKRKRDRYQEQRAHLRLVRRGEAA